jgi:hypothetical protein
MIFVLTAAESASSGKEVAEAGNDLPNLTIHEEEQRLGRMTFRVKILEEKEIL